MVTNCNKTNMLSEICFVRIILVVLVIVYHSFCPFVSSFWEPIMEPSSEISWYSSIARWSYAFMLEAFTFISGYIFGYQIAGGKHKITFRQTVLKKARRLLVPCVIFSLLYIWAFTDYENYNITEWGIQLARGAGHLWYLPMLLWCFVGIYIIEKSRISIGLSISLLLIVSLVAVYTMPFRLNEAAYYMIFFYIGYLIKRVPVDIDKFSKPATIVGLWICFIASFVCNLQLINVLPPPDSGMLVKGISVIALRFIKLISAFTGTFALLITSIFLIKNGYLKINNAVIKLSGYAFGVYILQEFIIRILYYKTSSVQFFGVYAPFVTVIITVLVSIIIVHICIKHKIGRLLLS